MAIRRKQITNWMNGIVIMKKSTLQYELVADKAETQKKRSIYVMCIDAALSN